ncbi:MAG: endonuclease/exonuclease/phosphatase family protein [Proteobacteria bacterium]|nr:endonuclease/exonuclease/phosphatase family protein [Pseudomonadota bacterium]
MRLVAWNCNMALHRKLAALRRLEPDIAVVSECAAPARLALLGALAGCSSAPVWVGDNPHKGLAVLAFNGYAVRLAAPFQPTLRHIAPVHVSGPAEFNLLAVWAQNASDGGIRKHRLGPLRRALTKYARFLGERPAIVAGDLNNNVIWHRPGWRINHGTTVAILERHGLVSAYHALRGEAQGAETVPTLYWRDRTRDGPTYHIDYIFLPQPWLARVRAFSIGTFDDWCGRGLSDHVPVVVELDI